MIRRHLLAFSFKGLSNMCNIEHVKVAKINNFFIEKQQ